VNPDFEEKTFEVAANFELGLLTPTVDLWAPGQVLEGVLGFDVMAELDGDLHDVNQLLGVAMPPGLLWKPYFGSPPGAGSAPDWASLFLQYKRPERMFRRRGKFLKLFPGKYYRFDLDADQHGALVGFRGATLGQALVCYASPRFHTNDDMMFYRQHRLVLERTAFIEVGEAADHKNGAYDEVDAFLCSEPERAPLYGLPGLARAIRQLDGVGDDSAQEGLLRHVRTLADAVALVSSIDDRTTDQLDLVDVVTSILTFAVANEATWLVCAR